MLAESSKLDFSHPFAPLVPQGFVPSYVVHVAESSDQLFCKLSQAPILGVPPGLPASLIFRVADFTAYPCGSIWLVRSHPIKTTVSDGAVLYEIINSVSSL